MNDILRRLAPAAALCLPLLALGQAARPDPAAPEAAAPALRYPSAFADYKRWQEIKPADWRVVNDTVRDAAAKGGGHAGHPAPAGVPASGPASAARGSTTLVAPVAPEAPVAPAMPAMPGHGGHHGHGGRR